MTIGTQQHCEAVHSVIYHLVEQQMCKGVSKVEFTFRPWDLTFQIYILKVYIYLNSFSASSHEKEANIYLHTI